MYSNKLRTILLTVAMIISAAFWFTPPQSVQASVQVVEVGGVLSNTGAIKLSNEAILRELARLTDKEFRIDPGNSKQVSAAIRAAMQRAARQILTINKGQPGYPVQLEQRLSDLAAARANSMKEQLANSQVCGVFKDELIAGFTDRYIEENASNFAESASCIWDDNDGYDAERIFEKGGARSADYIRISRSPLTTTPKGNELYYDRELAEQIAEAQENYLTDLSNGGGLESIYEAQQNVILCQQGEVGGVSGANCLVGKPGTFVRNEFESAFRLGDMFLANADELDDAPVVDVIIRTVERNRQEVLRRYARTNTGATPNPNPVPPPPGPTPPPPPPPPPSTPTPDPSNPSNPDNLSFVNNVTEDIIKSPTGQNNPVRATLIRNIQSFITNKMGLIGDLDAAKKAHDDAVRDYAQLTCYTLNYPQQLLNRASTTAVAASSTIDGIDKLHRLFVAYDDAVANDKPTTSIENQHNNLIENHAGVLTANQFTSESVNVAEFTNGPLAEFKAKQQEQVRACQAATNST